MTTWTVACFCGHTFTATSARCPRCGEPVPGMAEQPQPRRRQTAAT